MMAEKKVYTVDVGSLNLRTAPDVTADVVRILRGGEKVKKNAKPAPEGWTAVEGGFVQTKYLK